jgi:predicted nucleotidyltransferase
MLDEIRARKAELEQICRRYPIRRLELFGSAVSGRYREGESDLDFLVEFESLPAGAYADAYFGVLEALEDLFGRPVDLVVDSSIRNPYFRASVDSSKALLYAA